jgi:hypothetical protein
MRGLLSQTLPRQTVRFLRFLAVQAAVSHETAETVRSCGGLGGNGIYGRSYEEWKRRRGQGERMQAWHVASGLNGYCVCKKSRGCR